MFRPAILVLAREIGYLYGQYKRIRNDFTGVLTGKGIPWGGNLARKEATGFGLCYFMEEALKDNGSSFAGKTVVVSGSGNVAIYAAQKATELGAKVVAMSDSNGYVYDKNGIDLDLVKQLKEVERKRIKEYINTHKDAVYTEGCRNIWTIPCDIALPCATQNEIDEESAKTLVANGCKVVGRRCKYAFHARSDRSIPEERNPFWTRKSGECRWRCNIRA